MQNLFIRQPLARRTQLSQKWKCRAISHYWQNIICYYVNYNWQTTTKNQKKISSLYDLDCSFTWNTFHLFYQSQPNHEKELTSPIQMAQYLLLQQNIASSSVISPCWVLGFQKCSLSLSLSLKLLCLLSLGFHHFSRLAYERAIDIQFPKASKPVIPCVFF